MLVLGAGGRRGRSLRATRGGGGRGAAAPGGLAVPLCATAVLGRVTAASPLSLQRILIGSPLAQPLESFLPAAAAVSQLHCHPAGEERGPGEAPPPRSLAARLPRSQHGRRCLFQVLTRPARRRPAESAAPDPGPRAPSAAQTPWPRTQGCPGQRAAGSSVAAPRWPCRAPP